MRPHMRLRNFLFAIGAHLCLFHRSAFMVFVLNKAASVINVETLISKLHQQVPAKCVCATAAAAAAAVASPSIEI